LRVGVKALMEGDRLVASGGEHAGDRIDHVVSGTEGYVDGPPGHPGVRIEGVAEVSVVGGSWSHETGRPRRPGYRDRLGCQPSLRAFGLRGAGQRQRGSKDTQKQQGPSHSVLL